MNMKTLHKCPYCDGTPIFSVARTRNDSHMHVVFDLQVKCGRCGIGPASIFTYETGFSENGDILVYSDARILAQRNWDEYCVTTIMASRQNEEICNTAKNIKNDDYVKIEIPYFTEDIKDYLNRLEKNGYELFQTKERDFLVPREVADSVLLVVNQSRK